VSATGLYAGGDYVGTHGVARDVGDRGYYLERQKALHLAREEVWNMTGQDDIDKVLFAVRESIERLQVSFDECRIYLVDMFSDFPSVRTHTMRPDAEWWDLLGVGEETISQIWREGQPACRPDLRLDDPYREREYLEKTLGVPVRSILDIPFSHGTLSVASVKANAFSQEDIDGMCELAEVLSEGFRRQNDLRYLALQDTRYRKLVETPNFVLMLLELDGRYIYVSPQIEAYTGHPPGYFNEDLDNGPRIFHPEDLSAVKDALEQAVQGDSVQHLEFRWLHRDKDEANWVSGSFFPLYERVEDEAINRVSMIQLVVQDINDRKKMEKDLVRIARLRALWEVSAGIGHNLNNILVGVLGPAQLLRRRTEEERTQQQLDGIITSARRARELVQRLYQAVRGEEEEPLAPVSVNAVVEEAVQTAQPRWKDEPEARGISIRVEMDMDNRIPPVRGNQAGLNDILVNLIFNAVDAMPEGGKVIIRSRHTEQNVQLTVSDTGTGMDEETMQRVFEPFFTTKVEVGTGLGLSTVYGSVTRWGGSIDVKSAPGKGTTFTISLVPWVTERTQEKQQVEARAGRRGRVLVVEDDDVVRQVLVSLVSEQHEVETAANGPEALKRMEAGRYDVALVDLGMPEMPGDQVGRALKKIDPHLVAILITGWELPENDPKRAVFDFQLQKPLDDIDVVQDTLMRAVELHDKNVGAV